MSKPLQAGEDGGGVLPGAEGGIVVKEAIAGFELQHLVVVVHDGEVQRVASLVAAVPEVGDAPHVGVARSVDGRDEPLGARLSRVGDRLGNVLFRVGLAVAVGVVVGFHPVIEFKLHGMANLVLDEHLDGLLVGRRFVSVVDRSNFHAFGVRSVDEVRASPFAVGLLHVVGIAFVVGLNFVGQPVGDVDGRKVDGDEERTVVVGGVPSRGFNVAVA